MPRASRRASGIPVLLVVAFALASPPAALRAQAQWAIDDTFTSRFGSAAAFDAARGVTLVFGGHDGQLRDDTWQWNGVVWTRLDPAHRPPAQRGHAMVYDSVRQRIVLVGGDTGVSGPSQTWAWDGTDWTQLATASAPLVQSTMTAAYDAGRDRVVFVGGDGGSFVRVWEFDGSQWTEVTIVPPAWPQVQDPMLFTYDATAGNCALCRTNSSAGMWRWNGTAWTFQPSPATLLQFGSLLVHDPVQQRLLLVGGTGLAATLPTLHRWVPATATWQPLATDGPATSQHAACFDSVHNRVVVVGGARPGTVADSSVWEWEAEQWHRRTWAPPSAREGPGFAIDRASGRAVLYGGAFSSDLGDTWHWNVDRWELLIAQPQFAGSTHPGNARGTRLVFDEARGEYLLLRGAALPSVWFWRLAGTQWTPIPATGPAPRPGASVCYDRLRQRVLLYGGGQSTPFHGDLWSWDGTAWTQLSAPLEPPARTGGGMAHDPLRDRLVLTGGSTNGGNSADTWEFDGQSWTQFPAGAGPVSIAPLVVWDEARQTVVAVAGSLASNAVQHTWQWNGAAWSEIAPATTPPRFAAALASSADEVVWFGGRTGSAYPAPIARLRTPHPAGSSTFGASGASGAGPLQFDVHGPLPWLGASCTLRLSPLPAVALPGAWLGLSRTSWLGTPLPFDLGSIGHPGNAVHVAAEVPLPVLDLLDGTAITTIVVPPTAALAGTSAFVQAFVFEPLSSAVTTSNGVELRLGVR